MEAAQHQFGPVYQDLVQLQLRRPGLMPQVSLGRPWPDVYGPELLPAYRAAGAVHGTWHGWLQLTAARAGPSSSSALLLLAPFAFCAATLLLLARGSGSARRKHDAVYE